MSVISGSRSIRSLSAAAAAAMLVVATIGTPSASATPLSIVSSSDFESRLSTAGSYDPGGSGGSTTAATERIGFQSSFGSTGQPQGGFTTIYYFKLPAVTSVDDITSAHFMTSLLHDTASSKVTPRFSADVYALGFTSTPTQTAAASQSYYYIGHPTDTGPGINTPSRQLIQNNFFTLTDGDTSNNNGYHFPDYSSVNGSYNGVDNSTNTSAYLNKGTTADGDAALLAYVKSLYADPNFVNDGSEYLILRLNPDYASNDTDLPAYDAQGLTTTPAANGTSRYLVASSRNTSLPAGAVLPTLTLDVTPSPEPASIALLGVTGIGLLARRRRRGTSLFH